MVAKRIKVVNIVTKAKMVTKKLLNLAEKTKEMKVKAAKEIVMKK